MWYRSRSTYQAPAKSPCSRTSNSIPRNIYHLPPPNNLLQYFAHTLRNYALLIVIRNRKGDAIETSHGHLMLLCLRLLKYELCWVR